MKDIENKEQNFCICEIFLKELNEKRGTKSISALSEPSASILFKCCESKNKLQ